MFSGRLFLIRAQYELSALKLREMFELFQVLSAL